MLTALAPGGVSCADESAAFGDVEEIVVTGSRIRRATHHAQEALLSLEPGEVRAGGVSLSELLARLPASGSPLSTRFNSSGNFGFPADGGGVAAGAAQVDLRHLGSKRVLVLVDGLRWIHGSSGSGVSGATDLNTIPDGVIDRVEVSLDGASAIYGSDAIAGVVNLITRAADGFSASVSRGGFRHGGDTQEAQLAFGAERNGGDTALSLHLSHFDQARVSAAKHGQTRWPFPGTGNLHGSTFTPQGRIIFTDPNTGHAVNCALNDGTVGLPRYDPSDPCGERDDYHPWSNADRFNYAPYNLVITPSRRTGAFARLEHRPSDSVEVYVRLLANDRRSINQAAPEPLWAGTLAESGSLLDEIVIDAANPHNPFGFDLGAGAWATRRPLESGPRVFTQDVYTRHGAAGLRGVLAAVGRTFFWDANLVWSRNVARQSKQGAHNARNMMLALGPPEACLATPGCVPLNLLGGQGGGDGTITAAMLRWIGFTQRDRSDQTLRDFTLNLTGNLTELPAGPLAFAAGLELRAQQGRFRPDARVAAGETAGQAALPTSGDIMATEWYAEVEAPLLAGAPGAERLELSAALRRVRYDAFPADGALQAALRWVPRPGLTLRANWAEGFRAPNIGELFGGETRLDAVIADPCSDFHAGGVVRGVVERCVAAGVPADGSYGQLGSQVGVSTGGNRSLRPETSESVTLSLAWEPTFEFGAMRVELGRYFHEIEDAITGYDAQAVLDACYLHGAASFCEFVGRSPLGHIRRFRNTLLNVGVIRTSGWDLGIAAAGAGAWGSWRVGWQVTHLDEYVERLKGLDGAVVETRRLEGQTQSDRGKPRWKSSLAVNWESGRWSGAWAVRYIHAMTERCSSFLDGSPDSLTSLGLCSLPDLDNNAASRNRLGATVYHDARASWAPLDGRQRLTFTLGANNLFDRDPPISRSATLNGYDASTYDIPGGRYLWARIDYELLP